MALVTAKGVSSLAVALLTRTLVLPMTVSRVPGGEFAGDNGDTITVRVRTPRAARTQASPGATITYDALNETPVNVTLSHLYDAARLTDQDLSLNLVDFGAQVTEPQVASVATGAEDRMAAAMNAVTADAVSVTAANLDAKLIQARETLSEANVPAGDRFLACSPDIISLALQIDKFVRADAVGDGTAIREATVGRIYGFTVLESNGLTAGTALGYHRSGFVFANRVPVPPRGLPSNQTATTTNGGVGMRQIFQYQPDILSDASVLSTFAGGAMVDNNRVFKLTTAAS